MIGRPRRAIRWPDAVSLPAAVALVLTMVTWADRESLRLRSSDPQQRPHAVSRPDWVWAIKPFYDRAIDDGIWFCVAATIGAGGILAGDGRTWSRRGLSRPGTIVVFAALLVGGVMAAQQVAVAPARVRQFGLCNLLRNALAFRLPGTILGAWVVGWLGPRRGLPDWRERVARAVGWLWIAYIFLLSGQGLLFG